MTLVTVANYTEHHFKGWRRCTVDTKPEHPFGKGDGWTYALGRKVGDVWAIDVCCEVPKLSDTELHLSDAQPLDDFNLELPDDPMTFFGIAKIGDTMLTFKSLEQDGACYVLHLVGRPTTYLHVDIWLHWYPDMPGIATGEVIVTASNPSIPDMVATVPENFKLTFGDAIVTVDSFLTNELWEEGDTIADSQAVSRTVALGWLRNMTPSDIAVVPAILPVGGVVAYGLEKAWPTGNPMPDRLAFGWAGWNLPKVHAALSTWETAGIGVNPRSADQGAQEDQVFVGGRMAQEPIATAVRYYAALGQSRRPCHHLEANGELLRIEDHPYLQMWDSGPHYLEAISPDRLGKPRHRPTMEESHGWSGPDIGHLLINTLAIASRATGSYALQWQLANHARLFIFQQRRPKEWSPGWLRDVGWRALAAWHLWHGLEDRDMAERVRDEWLKDADHIIHSWLGRPWWWADSDDHRPAGKTGRTRNTMLWQHGVATYFLDLAGELFDRDDIRGLALYAARKCSELAFTWDSGAQRFKGWGYVGTMVDGTLAPLIEGNGAHWGPGVEEWMPLTPATVLRHEPDHERAQTLFGQFYDEAKRDGKWLPPEVLQKYLGEDFSQ